MSLKNNTISERSDNMNIFDLQEKAPHGTTSFPVAVYNSRWFIPHHWHKEDEFIYMIDGSAEYNVNGRRILLRPGDCAFCSGRSLHSMMLGEGQQIYFKSLLCDRSYLFPSGDICGQYFSGGKCIKNFYTSSIPAENEVIQTIKEVCRLMEQHPPGYEPEVKLTLMRIYTLIAGNKLYELETTDSIPEKNMLLVLEYIHTHFAEKMYIDELTSLTGYSKSHFEKFFKSYTGKTPSEYIMMYRLNMAEKLLGNADFSVLDIAERCGFSNMSYFIREFKKVYLSTPHRYRRAIAKNSGRER